MYISKGFQIPISSCKTKMRNKSLLMSSIIDQSFDPISSSTMMHIMQQKIFSDAISSIEKDASSVLFNLEEELKSDAEGAVNLIGDAALPSNFDEILAVVISEVLAGFVSGLAARLVAYLIGDKKRDTVLLKGTATGAYFGIRSLIVNVASILGISRPMANLLGGLVASLLSESTKIAGRSTIERVEKSPLLPTSMETFSANTSVNTTLGFLQDSSNRAGAEPASVNSEQKDAVVIVKFKKKKVIAVSEIIQDVSKWVVYDILIHSNLGDNLPGKAAIFGLVAGLSSHLIFEVLTLGRKSVKIDGAMVSLLSDKSEIVSRFAKEGSESAALFASYDFTLKLLNTGLPPQLQSILNTDFTDYLRMIPLPFPIPLLPHG